MESTYCGRGKSCTNVCEEFATLRRTQNAAAANDECLAVLYDDTNPMQQAQKICSGESYCQPTPGIYGCPINKPKMAYSRDLAVMDYHGLSWMTVMDDCYG